jgi:hypothetical protein
MTQDQMMVAGHNGGVSGHTVIIADMMSARSRAHIGRVADNKIAQKVAISVQNLEGLSNGIQSPCILADLPMSMNYGR